MRTIPEPIMSIAEDDLDDPFYCAASRAGWEAATGGAGHACFLRRIASDGGIVGYYLASTADGTLPDWQRSVFYITRLDLYGAPVDVVPSVREIPVVWEEDGGDEIACYTAPGFHVPGAPLPDVRLPLPGAVDDLLQELYAEATVEHAAACDDNDLDDTE